MIKKFNIFLDKLLVNITNWVIQNKYRIVGFIVLSILIVSLSFLPYLNLVLTDKLVIFIEFALFFVIFKISWKLLVYFCVVLFFIAFVLGITGFTTISMILGDYIYGFLIVIAIEYFILI